MHRPSYRNAAPPRPSSCLGRACPKRSSPARTAHRRERNPVDASQSRRVPRVRPPSWLRRMPQIHPPSRPLLHAEGFHLLRIHGLGAKRPCFRHPADDGIAQQPTASSMNRQYAEPRRPSRERQVGICSQTVNSERIGGFHVQLRARRRPPTRRPQRQRRQPIQPRQHKHRLLPLRPRQQQRCRPHQAISRPAAATTRANAVPNVRERGAIASKPRRTRAAVPLRRLLSRRAEPRHAQAAIPARTL